MESNLNKKKIILDEDEEEVVVPKVQQPTPTKVQKPVEKEPVKLNEVPKPKTVQTTLTQSIPKRPIPQPAQKNQNLTEKLKTMLNDNKGTSSNIKREPSKYENSKPSSRPNDHSIKKPNHDLLNRKRAAQVIEDSDDSSYDAEEEEEDSDYNSDEEESSESESSSESSSSRSERKKKPNVKKENNVKRESVKKEAVKKSENDTTKNKNQQKQKISFKTKETLVQALLKRWWYAIDLEWYKKGVNVEEELSRRSLRRVEVKDWKIESNIVDGKKKCVELLGTPLVFVDCDEQSHDLRNKESCPSFNNFIKKDKQELATLLAKAINNQLTNLESQLHPYSDKCKRLCVDLKNELADIKKEFDL